MSDSNQSLLKEKSSSDIDLSINSKELKEKDEASDVIAEKQLASPRMSTPSQVGGISPPPKSAAEQPFPLARQSQRADADRILEQFKEGEFVLLTPPSKLLERLAIIEQLGHVPERDGKIKVKLELQGVVYDEKTLEGTVEAVAEEGKDGKVTYKYELKAQIKWRGYWTNMQSPLDRDVPRGTLSKIAAPTGMWFKRYYAWDKVFKGLIYWRNERESQESNKDIRPKRVFKQEQLVKVKIKPSSHRVIEIDYRDQKDQKVTLKLLAPRGRIARKWAAYFSEKINENKKKIAQAAPANQGVADTEDPKYVHDWVKRPLLNKFPPPASEETFKVTKYTGRVVEVSMRIISIDSCQFSEGTYKVQFLLFMLWSPEDGLVKDWHDIEKQAKDLKDFANKGWEEFRDIEGKRDLLWKRYWNAETQISLTNMVESSSPDLVENARPKLIQIPNVKLLGNAPQNPDWTVLSVRPISATISQDWVLQGFPFDTQVLRLVFRPVESIDQVFIRPTSSKIFGTVMSPYVALAIPEWIPHQPRLHTSVDYFSLNRVYSTLVVGMPMRRNPSFHMWNTLFITFILQILSFTCYFIEVEDLGDRLGVTLTLLLTSTAFKLSMASSIPSVAYLTLADSFWIQAGGENLIKNQHWNGVQADNFDTIIFAVFLLWLLYLMWFVKTCYGYWQEGKDILQGFQLNDSTTKNYLYKNDSYKDEEKSDKITQARKERALCCCRRSGGTDQDEDQTITPGRVERLNKPRRWYNVPDPDMPWFMDWDAHQKPPDFQPNALQALRARTNQLLKQRSQGTLSNLKVKPK
eukprot:g13636.t1